MLEPAALAGAPNPQIQLPLLLKRAEDAAAAVSPRAGPAAMRRLLAPFRGGQQASSPSSDMGGCGVSSCIGDLTERLSQAEISNLF